ncbi:hypothetical protein Hypma_002251 [Hypsizygus marmoreus]|uniref:Uncharacterized protein n=1 Tax=Hypsizygus marmoreus TaxID=39966 RepID=A0A369K5D7_HYPMA|nr:hypothetical protein Hypma_002251 [Hypsizygus marmoreus]
MTDIPRALNSTGDREPDFGQRSSGSFSTRPPIPAANSLYQPMAAPLEKETYHHPALLSLFILYLDQELHEALARSCQASLSPCSSTPQDKHFESFAKLLRPRYTRDELEALVSLETGKIKTEGVGEVQEFIDIVADITACAGRAMCRPLTNTVYRKSLDIGTNSLGSLGSNIFAPAKRVNPMISTSRMRNGIETLKLYPIPLGCFMVPSYMGQDHHASRVDLG